LSFPKGELCAIGEVDTGSRFESPVAICRVLADSLEDAAPSAVWGLAALLTLGSSSPLLVPHGTARGVATARPNAVLPLIGDTGRAGGESMESERVIGPRWFVAPRAAASRAVAAASAAADRGDLDLL